MRADRLVDLILLLQRYGPMTIPELAVRLEVSSRPISRDLLPLSTDRGADGGRVLFGIWAGIARGRRHWRSGSLGWRHTSRRWASGSWWMSVHGSATPFPTPPRPDHRRPAAPAGRLPLPPCPGHLGRADCVAAGAGMQGGHVVSRGLHATFMEARNPSIGPLGSACRHFGRDGPRSLNPATPAMTWLCRSRRTPTPNSGEPPRGSRWMAS